MHDKVKLNFKVQKNKIKFFERMFALSPKPGKHVNGDQYVFHVVLVNELLHKVFNGNCLKSFFLFRSHKRFITFGFRLKSVTDF